MTTVITAWSSVSPYGMDAGALADGALSGGGTQAPVDHERWPVGDETACLVPGFDIEELFGAKGTRSIDRVTGLALATIGHLVESGSGVDTDTGLVLGTTNGGLQSAWETTTDMLVKEKPFYFPPARIPYVIMNGTSSRCAIWYKLHGPNATVATGRTSGLSALNYARRLIERGRADRMLCGGAEEYSAPRSWLDRRNRTADDAGIVLGEGCAILQVEAENTDRAALATVSAMEFAVAVDDITDAVADCVRRALKQADANADDVWAASPGGIGGVTGEIERGVLTGLFGAASLDRVPSVDLLGDTASATGSFQIALVLAAAAASAESAGKHAVVTTVDRDGMVACAVLTLAAGR